MSAYDPKQKSLGGMTSQNTVVSLTVLLPPSLGAFGRKDVAYTNRHGSLDLSAVVTAEGASLSSIQ
jgi:hypothetical protein